VLILSGKAKVWFNNWCECSVVNYILGYSQVVKTHDFDSCIRRFESYYPSHFPESGLEYDSFVKLVCCADGVTEQPRCEVHV
jgi:hypothetical protein